jgi:hypothetical protein
LIIGGYSLATSAHGAAVMDISIAFFITVIVGFFACGSFFINNLGKGHGSEFLNNLAGEGNETNN